MGHQDKVKKLGRTKPHREAMLANMAMSLFSHRMIKTTDAKAKALRPVVDRLIATAKKNTLASKRQVAKTIHVKDVFKKFYEEIVPQFSERDSGFTRVMKLGQRAKKPRKRPRLNRPSCRLEFGVAATPSNPLPNRSGFSIFLQIA